ncbi:MAG: hypothetical protein IJ661_12110 [Lachnospiraceae bacterium]|nr:hypothetical protein [Lachnospiraceae bacterium]
MKMYVMQHKLILAVDIVLLIIYAIVTFAAHNMAASLYSQQEAARWENDDIVKVTEKQSSSENNKNGKRKLAGLVGQKKMPYAQVSAFISPGRGVDTDALNGVRSSLQSTLAKDSYGESQTGGRVWIDAYSCEKKIELRKDRNTLSVTAVGVGGEFFQFHPMTLLSGSYISDSDLNHDRIVVDESFAWAMFGSNDIVGMQVWYGDKIYFVSGVVRPPQDNISQMAYGNGNRVYMCYNELKSQEEALPVTCYEAVYPNPISNYALNALKTAFGLADENDEQLNKKENPLSFDDVEAIENTKRFETMELITRLKQWRLRSMRASSVGYPFWENIARVQDETQMILLIVRGVLLICPIISFIWLIYGLWELKTWTIKGLILEEIEKEHERRIWKAYEKRMAEEEELAKGDSFEEAVEEDGFEEDGAEAEYVEVDGAEAVEVKVDDNEREDAEPVGAEAVDIEDAGVGAEDSTDDEEQVELKSVLDEELFGK